MHFARLCRAASLLGLKYDQSFSEFTSVLDRLVRRNNCQQDLYIRPIVFTNALGVGLMQPGGCSLGVFVEKMPLRRRPPCTACLVSGRRPSDGTYAAKISGNYVLSYLAQRDAAARNYDVGIMLSDRGFLSEASAMNLFWRIDNDVFTPSLNCGPLAGITRDTVIRLARDTLGLRVREGAYRPGVLETADEIFLTGTGTGITTIEKFESRSLPQRRNSVANQLWREYKRLVRENLRIDSSGLEERAIVHR
jgi:branched-chain amino acid aminotransferase